jgi:UDP-N-acetylglucosamine diphosphorylase/glucosamine-1-phosphate N-acetyltransferase
LSPCHSEEEEEIAVRICIFEDYRARLLAPLSSTRPVFDIFSGATSLLNKHQRFFSAEAASAIVRRELAEIARLAHPDMAVNDPESWNGHRIALVNARWIPSLDEAIPRESCVGMVDDEIAYVILNRCDAGHDLPDELAERLDDWRGRIPAHRAGGWMIRYPWDLLECNPHTLRQDVASLAEASGARATSDNARGGDSGHPLYVHPEAHIEPYSVFDTQAGPIWIDAGATVRAFSRIAGPTYVGPGSQIFGGQIQGVSIGPECRVGGEVEFSILHGFTNKYHEGFLGHSYLGEWVNVGAGTQFSDLRNDYGMIEMYSEGKMVSTGSMKIGSFVGDHSRISINSSVNVGTVVGPFCMLASPGTLLPRVFPSFTRFDRNGPIRVRTDLRSMFATAQTVLSRRGQIWTRAHEDFFLMLYDMTADERMTVLRRSEQRSKRR